MTAETDSVTQMIHSIFWPAQSRYHFVGCSSEKFTVACFPCTGPFLVPQGYINVYLVFVELCTTKDCSLISASFLWLRFWPNKYEHHVGDFLGDTLIYTSRSVNLCYCCLLQKYKEAFKNALHLPLITVHARKCHIIVCKVYCW